MAVDNKGINKITSPVFFYVDETGTMLEIVFKSQFL